MRVHVRAWADEFVAAMAQAPLIAAAVAEALERSTEVDPVDDHLWIGATRGLVMQHEVWRLDGPHHPDLHPVLGPL